MRILKLSILIAFIIFYGCRGTQTDSNNNEGVNNITMIVQEKVLNN